MTRAGVLLALGFGLAGLARADDVPTPRTPRAPQAPNVLILVSDDQGDDTLGYAGHPVARTPSLDRLAAEGARFTNAFVTTSLCSPGRASLITGQWVRRHGVRANGASLAADAVTLPSLLSAAGWETAAVGKWHLGGEQPGFEHTVWLVDHGGQGAYEGATFEIRPGGERQVAPGWVDDAITDRAIAFLRRPRERPFFLMVGFKSLHAPRAPPERHARSFEEVTELPLPDVTPRTPYPTRGDRKRLKEMGISRVADDWAAALPGGREAPTPQPLEQRLETERRYLAVLAALDENVGRILDALDELGLGDDTLVIYTSDNGHSRGWHGEWGKRSAYDASIRVPLLVRYPPRVAPAVHDGIALNVDVVPTVLELAGLPVPDAVQGSSLAPVLEGRAPSVRDAFLYEYFPERGADMPAIVAVRTPDWKLVTYPGHPAWNQLFDLRADPHELESLAARPEQAARMQSLGARLGELEAEIGPRLPQRRPKRRPR